MRSTFESITADLIERCLGPVEQAMADAKVTANDIDEVILVGGSTRIPAVQNLVRRLTGGKDPNMTVNPDEVVAVGAAIQAAIIKGEVKDVLLLDVTPLSLGVETMGGVMTKVIERNTTIPARRTETFSTAEDNQSAVDIVVLQGERERAADNRVLGPLPARGHPARTAGHAAGRGHLRHRRQRHPQRLGTGQGHRRRAGDHDQPELEPRQGRGRADDRRRRGATGPRTPASAPRSTPATSSTPSPTRSSGGWPSSATRCRRTRRPAPRCSSPTPARRSKEQAPMDRLRSLTSELQQVFHGLGASRPSGRPAGRQPTASRPAPTTTTSSTPTSPFVRRS